MEKTDGLPASLDQRCGSRDALRQDASTDTDSGAAAAARALSSSEEDGKPTRSSGSYGPKRAPAPRKRVRKPRKPTGTIRREEIAVLQKQIDRLQAKLKGMQPHAVSCSDCVQIRGANHSLRKAVKQQHLMMAGVHAVLTEYTRLLPAFPIHRFVHLGKDRASRQATLLAMKSAKLADAHELLKRRLPQQDPRRKFTDAQQFDTPEGDLVVVLLYMEKLQGARSVKQAYEIMVNQLYNIELRISEKLGNITIREDDELDDKEFQQIRLVSTTPSNVLLESNSIIFHSYEEKDEAHNNGRECAIATSDFVDEDKLYPYQPNDRVRRDISGIVRLTSHKTGPADDDVEVMITRYVHMRMHQPKFPVSPEVWEETVASVGRWTDFFLSSISDMLKES